VYKRILQYFDFEQGVYVHFFRDKLCACDKSQCTDTGAGQLVFRTAPVPNDLLVTVVFNLKEYNLFLIDLKLH